MSYISSEGKANAVVKGEETDKENKVKGKSGQKQSWRLFNFSPVQIWFTSGPKTDEIIGTLFCEYD